MTQMIDLESDVYAAAESLARRERSTVGSVVNQVLRRTLVGNVPLNSHLSEPIPLHLSVDPETGLPSVRCSRSFTSEDVSRCEMDMT